MVMIRVVCFFFNSIAVMALLPLVAQPLTDDPAQHAGARTFALLLAAMGAGAVSIAIVMPGINRRFTRDIRYRFGTLVFALATVVVALSPYLWLALLALYFGGAAWLFTANTLMVAAQLSLPEWVRARGLSIIQMAMMGATASGAAIWGSVASRGGVRVALLASAVAGPLALLLTRRTELGKDAPEELVPAGVWTHPELVSPIDPDEGPVLVMVEYQIDPARTDEFIALMRESRRVWLAHGLRQWNLFSDVSREGRHVEHMVDESWASYLRRNERIAASYLPLRERKMAMHVGADAPVVTRYIARH
jgi:MFS family permease